MGAWIATPMSFLPSCPQVDASGQAGRVGLQEAAVPPPGAPTQPAVAVAARRRRWVGGRAGDGLPLPLPLLSPPLPPPTHLHHHLPLQVTAVVRRDPSVGLGMELNAYNQILTVRRAQFGATLAQFCAIILTVSRFSSTAAPRHAVLRPSGRPDP